MESGPPYRVFARELKPEERDNGRKHWWEFWREHDPYPKPGMESLEWQARAKTAKASEALEETLQVMLPLPELLQASRVSLQKARKEFADRAFGPFWDAIESAVSKLAEFQNATDRLAYLASVYDGFLSDWPNNFPPFPTKERPIPDPRPVLQRLQDLMRKGETDFQFASILEQRRIRMEQKKTREVMAAGFQNLGDAIQYVGDRITSSLNQMEISLGAQLDSLLDSQLEASASEEQYHRCISRMLDNIQRGRKPPPFDV